MEFSQHLNTRLTTSEIPLILRKWANTSCAAARMISVQWQMNVKICEQNCGLTRYSVYSVAMSSHWSKLTRQVSEHCLFALPAAILDTCFQQEKQWKYLVRCHAEWVCLFRNSNLCSSGLSMHCTDTHTLINTWSHTHRHTHTFPW